MPENELTIIEVIKQATLDANVDVEKYSKLMELEERRLTKQAEIDFNEAMARVQPKIPPIKKTSKGHNSKYAKYEHVDNVLRPLYTQEGFSVSYNTEMQGDSEIYYGTLSHRSGHKRVVQITLPADGSGNKNAIQAKGSTMSYARRYLLSMLFNVVFEDEDDDGYSGNALKIDEDQINQLNHLIESLEDKEEYKPKFLNYMKVTDIVDITQKDFKKACAAVNEKIAHNAKENKK